MKDDRLYLIHIKECIERIESYIGNTGKSEFLKSTFMQDAVIRNLQVLAESSQRLSDETKETDRISTGIKSLAFAISLSTIISASIWTQSGISSSTKCPSSKKLLRKCWDR